MLQISWVFGGLSNMKRTVQFSLALITAVTVTACAGNGADENVGNKSTTAGATGTSGTSMDVDRDFVDEQLSKGEKEILLGRLAQQRGGSAEVRAFGEMMVADHTKAGGELKQIASRHNVSLPADDKDAHDDAHERLSKLSGAQFDRAYMDMMVNDHDDAVDDVRKKTESDKDHGDLRQWAVKALPVMEKHLERARQVRQQLDRANER